MLKTFLIVLSTATLAHAQAPAQNTANPTVSPETQRVLQDVQSTFGFVPEFVKQLPPQALGGAWDEFKGLELNPKTALTAKSKDLVSLAVAAQIPCRYCTYLHARSAKVNGASDEELREAVGMAANTRHWSTYLNGMQTNEAVFRKQVDQIMSLMQSRMKRTPAASASTSPQPAITTPDQAYADIRATLGVVPDFLKSFPPEGVVGAWKEMKNLQLGQDTMINGKNKELIGLAVSAQIPCHYCAYFHTKAAKLNGATDREVREAVALASVTRHWSTYLNGLEIDEATFKQDADRMLQHSTEMKARQPASQSQSQPSGDSTTTQQGN